MLAQLRSAMLIPAGALLLLTACSDADRPMAALGAEPTFAKTAADESTQLVALRQVTARFQNFNAAVKADYQTEVTPCWAHHSAGAMGYHYGNLDLFDANVELLEPEVLMYEPQAGGHLKLVGMEYIVPIAAWEAAGHDPADESDVPELLGQKFTPHSFLPIYKLHIWLWRNNPSGTFADWNPKVSCDHAQASEIF